MKNKAIILVLLPISFFLKGMNDLTVLRVIDSPLKSDEKYSQKDIQGEVKTIFVDKVEIASKIQAEEINFGQENGQKDFKKFLKNNSVDNFAIYASRHGTMTVLNYLGTNPVNFKPKAVVLRAPYASANSLMHNYWAKNVPELTANFPGAFYIIPYIMRMAAPIHWETWRKSFTYSPSGQQPIKSIKAISSTDAPIIIIKPKEEFLYDEASILYYGLVENGNKNVYLVNYELEASNILKKLKIIPSNGNNEKIDFSSYQPNHKLFEEKYNNLISKENNFPNIVFFTKVFIFSLTAIGVIWKFGAPYAYLLLNNFR